VGWAAAVVLAVALLALLVASAVSRRRLARMLRESATRLDPDVVATGPRLGEAVSAVQRAVDRTGARGSGAEQRTARLATALDGLTQGVVVYDEHGDLVYRNGVAATYSGARHSEALVEEAIGELAGAAIGGRGDARAVELFGPPRRTLALRAVPLDDGGHTIGALVVIDDVSERRRLENVRRDFVANISHELKTPVGALGLLAETLSGEDDPAVVQRLAERLQAEALRVGRTIDDLLELSRIEAEESRPVEPVPVHLVLAEAVERMRPAADQARIAIEVEEPSSRLTVLGDRRQLVSAMYNLLENAVKYSDAGSTVDVRATTNGSWVDVAVEDHGIGIPRRDLERVFERFYRVDRGRSRETGGTGLGLAIVRHVASNHQGEVRVESREGEGSVFTLRLRAGPGPVAVTTEAG
jgi:two-component system sensor histidine kinase SenX3